MAPFLEDDHINGIHATTKEPLLQGSNTNSAHDTTRAGETLAILQPLLSQLTTFLGKADDEIEIHKSGRPMSSTGTALIQPISISPTTLSPAITSSLAISDIGTGQQGLMRTVEDLLSYSVNTTAPGFLDKLYASPLPPGIAAELTLAVLNTNLHVYHVSPVLTIIEKKVTKSLAHLFGFTGPRAGGISVQGGSASNLTSIVIARNTLFPGTKTEGNDAGHPGKLILFTSAHGHYSIEKAAQALGLGSANVVTVPVDPDGKMVPQDLEKAILKANQDGNTPFYINATAGTTVLGSFDPFQEIAEISRRYRCWLHVDGAWGGGFVFATRADIRASLRSIEKADSIGVNPHKMLGVPVTCSFLLTRDLRLFENAMTLKAGYLFHESEVDDETAESKNSNEDDPILAAKFMLDAEEEDEDWTEPNDLADMTLQCGRRGDSLKFFFCWQYYGTIGYREKVENAYDTALYMAKLVDQHVDLQLVLGKGSTPQCLQVCFYYTPKGQPLFGTATSPGVLSIPDAEYKDTTKSTEGNHKLIGRYNTLTTSRITKALVSRGFMIDFAPALDGQEDLGSFFRVVINISTIRPTVERLVTDLVDVGSSVQDVLDEKYRRDRN